MPKQIKPKAVERRKLDKSIKKKYDRFRRRYPEVHGKVAYLACIRRTSH
jgi:hypothetical protein